MSGLRVVEIVVYPVKSMRATPVREAEVERRGLARDRRFMVVDEGGQFLSQRQTPRLATIDAAFAGDELTLCAEGRDPLNVSAAPTGATAPVVVWGDTCSAVDCGEDVARWLSAHLERPARLVYMPDDTRRAVDPDFARGPHEIVSFADGFPLLVGHTASLDALNERLVAKGASPVGMDRFRANLVVEGGRPFEEDEWSRIRIGEVVLRLPKRCGRCVATTTDQRSGARGPEPLRTLAEFRVHDGEAMFAMNAVAETVGMIRLGDDVTVLS